MRDGVLVVDKPEGPTSHDVVERVRRGLGVRRAGHTGTLDPLATGVLPVCLGKATRLARFLAGGEKVYRAGIALGFATTTDDREGEPLGPPVPVRVDAEALARACAALTGRLRQVPPAFSARRVQGRRLYDLARAGLSTPAPPAEVTVHEIRVLAVSGAALDLEVRCTGGTYVRALARDLGALLGVGGHLASLRRLRSGPFDLHGAAGYDEIPAAADRIRPLAALLTDFPAVRVSPDGVAAVRHGREITRGLVVEGFPTERDPPARLRVLDEQGALVALAVPRGFGERSPELPVEATLHPDVVLVG